MTRNLDEYEDEDVAVTEDNWGWIGGGVPAEPAMPRVPHNEHLVPMSGTDKSMCMRCDEYVQRGKDHYCPAIEFLGF